MNKDIIVNKFLTNPANLRMGAGKLSLRWKCTKEDIYAAKEKARLILSTTVPKQATSTTTVTSQATLKQVSTKYLGSDSSAESSTKKYESLAPLTPDEIKELTGVDGINTYISKVVDRMLPTGHWSYTVEVKYNNRNFYSRTELVSKLKEIFPDIKPVSIPVKKAKEAQALVILLSDDHVGSVNDNSIYGNEWSESHYHDRLMKVSEEVKKLGRVFEEIHILSLGDQLNGWNSQTTRGGHEVKSLSNKDQFDIYTKARVAFYNDLFTSGCAETYHVHDVENSNHSGNDFSYMANKFLEMYITSKFPQVKRKSYFLPIEMFNYGIHTIGFTHGKDEKLMTRPMPLKLDPRTDLFLFEFFDNKGISPKNNRVTLYKGDLHSYAIDKGKFGRYINIPSIMGGTDWTEINFGNSEPGAVMEIFSKNSSKIEHIPVWFER